MTSWLGKERHQNLCPVHQADACTLDCGFVPLPPITVADIQAAVRALIAAATPAPINEGSLMERDLHIRLYDLIATSCQALTASTEEGSWDGGQSATSELEGLVAELRDRLADVNSYVVRVAGTATPAAHS